MTDKDQSNLARRTILGVTGSGILGLGAVSGSAAGDSHTATDESNTDTASGGYDVDEILADWDEEPTEIAETVIEKHGDPDVEIIRDGEIEMRHDFSPVSDSEETAGTGNVTDVSGDGN